MHADCTACQCEPCRNEGREEPKAIAGAALSSLHDFEQSGCPLTAANAHSDDHIFCAATAEIVTSFVISMLVSLSATPITVVIETISSANLPAASAADARCWLCTPYSSWRSFAMMRWAAVAGAPSIGWAGIQIGSGQITTSEMRRNTTECENTT